MLFTPEQFILLGVLLLGGLLIGYACAPSPRKWKRRVREQSDSFTEHYAALEERFSAATRRVTELEGQVATLRDAQAEAERTITTLRAEAAAAPVAAVADPVVQPAAPTAVESATPRPVEDAEWVPVAPEPHAAIAAEPVAALPEPDPAAPSEHSAQVQEETAPVEIIHEPAPVVEPQTAVVAHPANEGADVDGSVVERQGETREGAPASGGPFPVHADEAAPGEAAATLPADTAPPAAPLSEPVAPAAEPAFVAPMTPVSTDAPPAPIGPAEPAMPTTGWFASSARDDLTRIRGIDGVLNTRLFALGVTRFEDLEKLSAEDEMALEQRLALPAGYIAREEWRTQSALLRAGQTEEHALHFGKEPVAAG